MPQVADVRRGLSVVGLGVLLMGPGCIDIVGSDLAKYVEREEKHFAVSGRADVKLSTFDGSIEVRPWDKAEVQVVVEKRARDKADAEEIDIRSEQSGNRVVVEVKARKSDNRGLHLGWNNSRSAKLIVSMPPSADLSARSGDGSIDVERITGHVDLRSGDGSIHARDLGGDIAATSGDGSIKLTGKLAGVRAHTGDGSVTVRAENGSAAGSDWEISTGDGSVTLELPDAFGAELDAHTGDGGIQMHDITVADVTGRISRNSVRGRIGAGGKQLRVRTGDGSITLKRF